ncbi:MAG: TPM domain-containing protein [Bacteroidota bacterium]|nr:TPM domain-containing protein [Bacteroidota bacterium]
MKFIFTFLFLLLFFCPNTRAQNVPDYVPFRSMNPAQLSAYRQSIWDTLPAAVGWVNDFEDLFTPPQEHYLEKILEHFEKATSIEISIVTVDSNMVAEDKFDDFSYRLMKIWGIGKITKSNGIVICICKDYRRICVTTDFGIDKYINESDKSRMINREFVPYFAKNDYYDGIYHGLNAMLSKINKRWAKSDDAAFLTK